MKDELFPPDDAPAARLRPSVAEEMTRRGVPAELLLWLQSVPSGGEPDADAAAQYRVQERFVWRFSRGGKGEGLVRELVRKVREGMKRGLFKVIGPDRQVKWALVELGDRTCDNSTIPLMAAAIACSAPDLRPVTELQSKEALRLVESGWDGKGAQ